MKLKFLSITLYLTAIILAVTVVIKMGRLMNHDGILNSQTTSISFVISYIEQIQSCLWYLLTILSLFTASLLCKKYNALIVDAEKNDKDIQELLINVINNNKNAQ